MKFFIITVKKYSELKRNFFLSDKPIPQNSYLLFFVIESEKIYAEFKVVRIKKYNNIYKIYYKTEIKLRRGVPVQTLQNILNPKIIHKKLIKIEQKKVDKILQILKDINFPQLASDILYLDISSSKLNINYLKNYPDMQLVRESININKKVVENYTQKFVSLIKNESDISSLKNMGFKLFSLFAKSNILSKNVISNRYIMIASNNSDILAVPFEIMFDGKNFLIEKTKLGRGTYIENLPYKTINLNKNSDVTLVIPKYKNNVNINKTNILNLLKTKNLKYEIYNKKITYQEFIHICENSKILYFSGHSIFNQTSKDYALRLSDNEIFHFQDFQVCSNLPELIIFHSCIENAFLKYLIKNLRLLFENGVKNILAPFVEIPIQSDTFINFFIKKLLAGYSIGEAFTYASMNGIKANLSDWKFFRLWGDPKIKYF